MKLNANSIGIIACICLTECSGLTAERVEESVEQQIMSDSWHFWYDHMRDSETGLCCDEIDLGQYASCNKGC